MAVNIIIEILLLLVVANGSPIIARHLFPHELALRVDFGCRFLDKRACFGANKTWRGIFASLAMTALSASLLGYDFVLGLEVAALAMAGDLASSFIKRRFGQQPGSRALLLDQVPESLLPAWCLMDKFGIDLKQVIILVLAFILVEYVLSLVLYKLGVRKNPY